MYRMTGTDKTTEPEEQDNAVPAGILILEDRIFGDGPDCL